MAMKIGSLLPSSRLDGLALLCSKRSTTSSSSIRSASHSGETSGSPKSCGEQHAQISAWTVLGRACSRCTPSSWRLWIARTRGLTSSTPFGVIGTRTLIWIPCDRTARSLARSLIPGIHIDSVYNEFIREHKFTCRTRMRAELLSPKIQGHQHRQ